MNHLIFEKSSSSSFSSCGYSIHSEPGKENVLILPLKRLMPENVINGVISDGVFGSYKW